MTLNLIARIYVNNVYISWSSDVTYASKFRTLIMEIDLHSFFGNSAKRNNGRDSSSQSKKTKQHGGYNSGNSDSKSAAAAGSSLCPPSSAVSATKICTPPSECNPISTETKLLCDRRDTSVMMLTIPPPSSASHKITTVNGGGGGGGGEGVISPLSGLALTASNSASAASTPSIGLISEPNNDASSTASGLHFYITDDDETGGVSPSSAGVESVRLPFLGGTATAGTGGGKGGCELRPGSGLSRSEGSSPMFFFGSSQHHNHHGHGLGQGHTQSLLSTNRSANGLLLPPPIITFNGVDSSASAPPSPNDTLLLAAAVRKWRLSVGSGAGASMSRDAAAAHRALMVTSSGSLLTMNHLSPSDIRGSSFSLHYPYDSKFCHLANVFILNLPPIGTCMCTVCLCLCTVKIKIKFFSINERSVAGHVDLFPNCCLKLVFFILFFGQSQGRQS